MESAAVSMDSCACAAVDEVAAPTTPVAAPTSQVVAVVHTPPGDVGSLRGRARGRPSTKPKIDIDDEIQEANRLADLFKRMQHASKVAARNATRSKQRLAKKASKLSAQDLMRMAVMKRCGLVELPDNRVEPGATVAVGAAPVESVLPKGQDSAATLKLKNMVGNIPGAAELLKSIEAANVSKGPHIAESVSEPSTSQEVVAKSSVLKGLKRLPSRPLLPKVASKKAASEQSSEVVASNDAESDDGSQDEKDVEEDDEVENSEG
jgi:hypothetical protein